MKMKLLTTIICMLAVNSAFAQTPWKCKLTCEEVKGTLLMDLYEESIDVPGMEMFGPMNGYLSGKNGSVYGTWMITSFKIKNDKEASIRLSNDLGSDTQECELVALTDSTFKMELKGGVVIKKVVNKKLVKLPHTLIFQKK